MIDQHEIDRTKILDLLEQTSDTVIRQVIEDCKDLLHRRTVAKLYKAFGEGNERPTHATN